MMRYLSSERYRFFHLKPKNRIKNLVRPRGFINFAKIFISFLHPKGWSENKMLEFCVANDYYNEKIFVEKDDSRSEFNKIKPIEASSLDDAYSKQNSVNIGTIFVVNE